jgi:hypothetical protein
MVRATCKSTARTPSLKSRADSASSDGPPRITDQSRCSQPPVVRKPSVWGASWATMAVAEGAEVGDWRDRSIGRIAIIRTAAAAIGTNFRHRFGCGIGMTFVFASSAWTRSASVKTSNAALDWASVRSARSRSAGDKRPSRKAAMRSRSTPDSGLFIGSATNASHRSRYDAPTAGICRASIRMDGRTSDFSVLPIRMFRRNPRIRR